MQGRNRHWPLIATVAVALALPLQADAGRIVVAHDEWTLSDTGFTAGGGINDPGMFADNVARWFTGGGTGTFHAFSTNFGLTGGSLATAMSSAGHTYTSGAGPSFDLPGLLAFDGIFLAGPLTGGAGPGYAALLTSYVNAGGNVYLAAGSGSLGGPGGEALQWDPFLNNFGLDLDNTTFNGLNASRAIANAHPIFAGVDHLYDNNGSFIADIDADPRSQILVSTAGGGLYAVWDDAMRVPEPASLLLLGLGLAGLAGIALAGRRWTRKDTNRRSPY